MIDYGIADNLVDFETGNNLEIPYVELSMPGYVERVRVNSGTLLLNEHEEWVFQGQEDRGNLAKIIDEYKNPIVIDAIIGRGDDDGARHAIGVIPLARLSMISGGVYGLRKVIRYFEEGVERENPEREEYEPDPDAKIAF